MLTLTRKSALQTLKVGHGVALPTVHGTLSAHDSQNLTCVFRGKNRSLANALLKSQDHPPVMLALLLDFFAEHPADFLGIGHMGAAARLDVDPGNFDHPYRTLDHRRRHRLGAGDLQQGGILRGGHRQGFHRVCL